MLSIQKPLIVHATYTNRKVSDNVLNCGIWWRSCFSCFFRRITLTRTYYWLRDSYCETKHSNPMWRMWLRRRTMSSSFLHRLQNQSQCRRSVHAPFRVVVENNLLWLKVTDGNGDVISSWENIRSKNLALSVVVILLILSFPFLECTYIRSVCICSSLRLCYIFRSISS